MTTTPEFVAKVIDRAIDNYRFGRVLWGRGSYSRWNMARAKPECCLVGSVQKAFNQIGDETGCWPAGVYGSFNRAFFAISDDACAAVVSEARAKVGAYHVMAPEDVNDLILRSKDDAIAVLLEVRDRLLAS